MSDTILYEIVFNKSIIFRMLSSAPNEWSNIDQIICKNVQWTASDHALPAPM